MRSSKAIVINALSRGGSNILWNILQSHPQVCSPIIETGQLINGHVFPFRCFSPKKARRMAKWPAVRVLGRNYVHRTFHQWKLRNLECPDNGTKYEGVRYTLDEVENSILCFKGVDNDFEYNALLESVFADVAYVGLVRSGYAVCNGWMRRGMSPESAGRKYRSVVQEMLNKKQVADTYVLVRFEEMLSDPFGTAERLFQVLGLSPTNLPKLRLKSKRVLTESGAHESRFGEENRKYWLGPHEVAKVLDSEIDNRQASSLEAEAREAFEREARPVLEELGYLENFAVPQQRLSA